MVERFREPELPSIHETTQRTLLNEAYKLLADTEDPVIIEVAEKIISILEAKRRINQIQQGADQTDVYQTLKQLGIFWVREHEAAFSWHHPGSTFNIDVGDTYLDLHLPPISEKQKRFTLITKSFQLIAEYIKVQNLKPKYIIGITYQRLGTLSKRYGFTVVEPNLPPKLSQSIRRAAQNGQPNENRVKGMDKIVVCYQDTEQFLDRFSPDPLISALRLIIQNNFQGKSH